MAVSATHSGCRLAILRYAKGDGTHPMPSA